MNMATDVSVFQISCPSCGIGETIQAANSEQADTIFRARHFTCSIKSIYDSNPSKNKNICPCCGYDKSEDK